MAALRAAGKRVPSVLAASARRGPGGLTLYGARDAATPPLSYGGDSSSVLSAGGCDAEALQRRGSCSAIPVPPPSHSCKEIDHTVTRSGFGDLALRPAATCPSPLKVGVPASSLQLLRQRPTARPFVNSYGVSGAAQFILTRGLCDDLNNRLNRLNHGKTHEKLKEIIQLSNLNHTAGQSILKILQELSKDVKMATSFKYNMRSVLIFVLLALAVGVLMMKAGVKIGAEDYAKTYLRELLNDPDLRKDVQSVGHLFGDSIYERVSPWDRFKSWWYKRPPSAMMTMEDMALRVTSFSFIIVNLVHAAGRFEEDELLAALERIGMLKAQMRETIKLLHDQKFLKKEVTKSTEGKEVTYYLLGEHAFEDCFTGNMKAKIVKAVKRYHVFGDLTN